MEYTVINRCKLREIGAITIGIVKTLRDDFAEQEHTQYMRKRLNYAALFDYTIEFVGHVLDSN